MHFAWLQEGAERQFPSERNVCCHQKCLQSAAVQRRFTFMKGEAPASRQGCSARENPNQQRFSRTLLPNNCILWCSHVKNSTGTAPVGGNKRGLQAPGAELDKAGGIWRFTGVAAQQSWVLWGHKNHRITLLLPAPAHPPELAAPSCLIRLISGRKKLLPVMFIRARQPPLHTLEISTSRQGKLMSDLGLQLGKAG